MKYIVTQKIEPFGLQAGDVFEENNDGTYSREFRRIPGEISLPKIILDTHPDWFQKLPEIVDLDFVKEAIKEVKKIYTSDSSRKALRLLSRLLEEE